MNTFSDRFQELLRRIGSYSPVEVLVELLIIGLIVWVVVRFVQGTRAAGALRGILVLFVFLVAAAVVLRILGGQQAFPRLGYLTNGLIQVAVLALIVVFQPELRRALIRMGEAVGGLSLFRRSPGEVSDTIDSIVEACGYLSLSRFGAIIAIERQIGLSGLTEGGTTLDAKVSARLLQTIFFPGTALHDLAVIVRGDQAHAAGVQLPLADPQEMPNPSFGSRHRAAVGLTKECDALAVVVSEETGRIRVAERGQLSEALTTDELGELLRKRLGRARSEDGDAVFEESGDGNESTEKEKPAGGGSAVRE